MRASRRFGGLVERARPPTVGRHDVLAAWGVNLVLHATKGKRGGEGDMSGGVMSTKRPFYLEFKMRPSNMYIKEHQ